MAQPNRLGIIHLADGRIVRRPIGILALSLLGAQHLQSLTQRLLLARIQRRGIPIQQAIPSGLLPCQLSIVQTGAGIFRSDSRFPIAPHRLDNVRHQSLGHVRVLRQGLIQMRQLLASLKMPLIGLSHLPPALLLNRIHVRSRGQSLRLVGGRAQLRITELAHAGRIDHTGQRRLPAHRLQLRRIGQHFAQPLAIGAALQISIQPTKRLLQLLPQAARHPGLLSQRGACLLSRRT